MCTHSTDIFCSFYALCQLGRLAWWMGGWMDVSHSRLSSKASVYTKYTPWIIQSSHVVCSIATCRFNLFPKARHNIMWKKFNFFVRKKSQSSSIKKNQRHRINRRAINYIWTAHSPRPWSDPWLSDNQACHLLCFWEIKIGKHCVNQKEWHTYFRGCLTEIAGEFDQFPSSQIAFFLLDGNFSRGSVQLVLCGKKRQNLETRGYGKKVMNMRRSKWDLKSMQ